MFKQFKLWLLGRFLPTWAREEYEGAIAALKAENRQLKQDNAQLESYAQGLEFGIRAVRKITITR